MQILNQHAFEHVSGGSNQAIACIVGMHLSQADYSLPKSTALGAIAGIATGGVSIALGVYGQGVGYLLQRALATWALDQVVGSAVGALVGYYLAPEKSS